MRSRVVRLGVPVTTSNVLHINVLDDMLIKHCLLLNSWSHANAIYVSVTMSRFEALATIGISC